MKCTGLAECYYSFIKLKIAGIVPVDKTLHIIVGYLLMLFILKKIKPNFLLALGAVSFLALAKELVDSRVLEYTLEEGVYDFLASIILPSMMIGIRRLKTGKYT